MPLVGNYIFKNSVLFYWWSIIRRDSQINGFREYIVHEFWTTEYARDIFFLLTWPNEERVKWTFYKCMY